MSSLAKRPMNGTEGNSRNVSLITNSKYGNWFNLASVVGVEPSVPNTLTISFKHFAWTSGFLAMLYKQNVMPDVVVSWPYQSNKHKKERWFHKLYLLNYGYCTKSKIKLHRNETQ